MELWLKVSLMLCTFGFLKELRPSEPFVTPYFVGPWRNFTTEQVNQELYPVGTYSYLLLLIVVFLVTDFLRYKAVIILDALCGIITWSLIIWVPGLFAAQVLEFFYGAFMAGEVAYYSYAYARVENRDLYARLSAHTRSAYLFGRCASGILGQALYSTEAMDLWELNFISFAALCSALVVALFLPPVKHSIYFHRKHNDLVLERAHDGNENSLPNVGWNPSVDHTSPTRYLDGENNGFSESGGEQSIAEPRNREEEGNGEDGCVGPDLIAVKMSGGVGSDSAAGLPPCDSIESRDDTKKSHDLASFFTQAFNLLWKHAYTSYSDKHVVKWSLWWSISTAGFLQVFNYIQVLWEVIIEEEGVQNVSLLNGAVEAIQTILGALATLACGVIRLNWDFVGEFSLAGVAVIEGLVMILSATAQKLWLAYVCYIIFGIFYQAMMTVASMEVAKRLQEDCYGLIFGINTFLSLVLQTIWTVVIISDDGFALGPRDQFLVCGGYFLLLGLIFLVVATVSICQMGLSVFLKQQLWLPKATTATSEPE